MSHFAHWIGGERVLTEARSTAGFSQGSTELVARACAAADAAFLTFGWSSREMRAALLRTIADGIEARAEAITAIGTAETGLPAARLNGERGRTTGQLRLFADHILKGDYLDRRHDPALPDRLPAPRPDLRLMQRPIGPVAVFGASNFPLAFSVAGGDTAAALAAGCPVVVKGHPAHPGTGEIVADAIAEAVAQLGLPGGVFSLVQDGGPAVGAALVTDPRIKAVGFTGSLRGGRALFDLCAARPAPIPFFGELGSVNPVFLLPGALALRSARIARDWAASLTMGAGQFCTNPGVVVVIDSPGATVFRQTARTALDAVLPQVMLSDDIAFAYRSSCDRMRAQPGVQTLLEPVPQQRSATPALLAVTGDHWLANPDLGDEVFGPLGLVVTVRDGAQMVDVAQSLHGQLTCTLHLEADDTPLARRLLPILETRAGRILANGFPTGVEVADSMVHGGPYPASTNFGATSVGTLSIRRFLRPVCYQDLPADLLSAELS